MSEYTDNVDVISFRMNKSSRIITSLQERSRRLPPNFSLRPALRRAQSLALPGAAPSAVGKGQMCPPT